MVMAAVLAGLLSVCEAPGARADEACVPFTTIGPNGGPGMIEAMLDGRGPFQMVVDTGATMTVISTRAAGVVHPQRVRGTASAIGAGGAFPAYPALLSRLSIGAAERTMVPVAVVDTSRLQGFMEARIDGFLGYSFLSDYRVSIDYPQHRLCFDS